jgi:threonine/homoserine efflux transporter RhtA
VVSGAGATSLAHSASLGSGSRFSAAGTGGDDPPLSSHRQRIKRYRSTRPRCPVAGVLLLPIAVAEGGVTLCAPAYSHAALQSVYLQAQRYIALESTALRRVPLPVYGVLASFEPAVAVVPGPVISWPALETRELVGIALMTFASMVQQHAPVCSTVL